MSEKKFAIQVGRSASHGGGYDRATISASNSRAALHKWAEQNLEPGFSIMAYGQGGKSFVVTGSHGSGMSATVHEVYEDEPATSHAPPSQGRPKKTVQKKLSPLESLHLFKIEQNEPIEEKHAHSLVKRGLAYIQGNEVFVSDEGRAAFRRFMKADLVKVAKKSW